MDDEQHLKELIECVPRHLDAAQEAIKRAFRRHGFILFDGRWSDLHGREYSVPTATDPAAFKDEVERLAARLGVAVTMFAAEARTLFLMGERWHDQYPEVAIIDRWDRKYRWNCETPDR